MEFHSLKVTQIKQETSDTVSITFDIPESLANTFNYKPGQYITIKQDLPSGEIRRSYSLSSIPGNSDFTVTVKAVPGGKMSVFLNEKLKVGQKLDVSAPEGRFTVAPDPDAMKDHYFIAAGSGITPVLSMIGSILEGEPQSTCYLLYGSRDEENIIFKETLDEWLEKYKDQLYVVHTLSSPKKSKSNELGGMIGLTSISWDGEKGRITAHKIKDFLGKYSARSGNCEYYLCGPGNLIEIAERHLKSINVASENIHKEYFSTTTDTVSVGSDAVAEITLDGKVHTISVSAEETVLEAALRHNLEAPYSCTSGACSTCLAKSSHGDIKMDVCYALEPDEVDEGYILTCQARIQSEKAIIDYDV